MNGAGSMDKVASMEPIQSFRGLYIDYHIIGSWMNGTGSIDEYSNLYKGL